MQDVELSILYWFQQFHNPVLNKIELFITTLGDNGILWILITLLMLIFCKKKKGATTAVFALGFSVLICNLILKNAVARPRPCWISDMYEQLVEIPDDFSFPSGHTSAAFSFTFAILPYYKKQGIAALVLSILIALSRLYLFVHWPTDVLFGVLLGIADGLVAYILVNFISKKINHDTFIGKFFA